MKKALKITSNVVTILLFVLLILTALLVITSRASGGEPQIFGYQLKTVLSGSMEPTFQTGSIIAVKPVQDPSTIKVNDIITFTQQDESLVTHRVIDVIQNGDYLMFQTKGDHNESPDSQLVLAENVRAIYTGFTIPFVGYFIDFARVNTAWLLIIPGILLLGYAGYTLYQAFKEIDQATKAKEEEKPV